MRWILCLSWLLVGVLGLAWRQSWPSEFHHGNPNGTRRVTVAAADSSNPPRVSASPQPVAVAAGGAFATWSTTRIAAPQYITLSNGNLTATGTDTGMVLTDYFVEASTANNYWEIHIDAMPVLHNLMLGISPISETVYDMNFPGYVTGYGLKSNGDTYANSVRTYPCPPPPGSLDCLQFGQGDGVKILLKHGSLYFGKIGGAWAGDPIGETGAWATAISGLYSPGFSAYQSYGYVRIVTANFGASPWLDTPPAGAVGWQGEVIFIDGFDGP